MDNQRWFASILIFAFVIAFTAVATGCSAPSTPSPIPSPTATGEEYSIDEWEGGEPIMDIPEEFFEREGLVPGQYHALIDGEWVEVTIGSVIGQGKVEPLAWHYPLYYMKYQGMDEKPGFSAGEALDPETGLLYVYRLQFRGADGNMIKHDEIMPYFEYYGIDHTIPSPTPTPSVWLTTIEISPSSLKDGITVEETVQFTATGTYSDGSTKDITSEAMWFSTNWHAIVSPTGLATGVSTGDTFIWASLSSVSSHVYLDVRE